MTQPITVPCSGDMSHDVTLHADGRVTAVIPSNGIRGKRHVPAREVTGEWWTEAADDVLLLWDCPVCGHADSYDESCGREDLL